LRDVRQREGLGVVLGVGVERRDERGERYEDDEGGGEDDHDFSFQLSSFSPTTMTTTEPTKTRDQTSNWTFPPGLSRHHVQPRRTLPYSY
jgi:hypothetical protein